MPRQGDQIGWRLFSNVGERVVAWTKAGEKKVVRMVGF